MEREGSHVEKITTGDTLEEAEKRILRSIEETQQHSICEEDIVRYHEKEIGQESTFCPGGYAFTDVVDDGFDYQVLICDARVHWAIMRKKNPREKDDDREITIGANGEPEMADSEEDNFTIN